MAYIRKKISKGIAYYSIVESYREPGTQKVKQRVLLNIGNESELMKFAFHEYSANQSVTDDVSFKAYAHGAGMALFWTAQMIGVEEMMNQVFPPKTIGGLPRSRVLLLAMLQRAIEPGSKRAFESWVSKTSLPYHLSFDPSYLTSQAFWEAMDGITEQQIHDVWHMLVVKLEDIFHLTIRKFHLDYTNFFTFINSQNCRCLICSLGHNKQKRNDLRQFSLAVITSPELLIPIVWEVYEGNCNDTVEFSKFMKRVSEAMKRLGIPINEITITFDGGSNSQDNFSELECHFICAHTLTSHKDLYAIDLDQYETVVLEGGKERLAYRIDNRIFSGVKGTGILTFSQALKDGQMRELQKDLEAAWKVCTEINQRLLNPRSKIYQDLRKAKQNWSKEQQEALQYNAQIEEEWKAQEATGGRKGRKKKPKPVPAWDENKALREMVAKMVFTDKYLQEFCWITLVVEPNRRYFMFFVDECKKDAYCRKYYGKKLTVTDHKEWTTEQILEEYCAQECIENGIFKVLKDPDYFHVRPQYHWTDDKILVHVFICLASMTLGEVLFMQVKSHGIKISKNEMLSELNNIKDGWIYKGERKVERKIEHLELNQEKLWNTVMDIFKKE